MGNGASRPRAGAAGAAGGGSGAAAASPPHGPQDNAAARRSTLVAYDDRMLLHAGPRDHPEQPARASTAFERLRTAGLLDRCVVASARPATDDELLVCAYVCLCVYVSVYACVRACVRACVYV